METAVTFLAPGFLAALGLVAVPIAIHFLTRMRRRTLPMPTIRFLREAEASTSRRRRFKDLALLLLRVAAVTCLALAFARPTTMPAAASGPRAGGTSRLVLMIDRSASMSYREGDRTNLSIAIEEAVRLLRSVEAGSRVTVIAYDDAPEILARDADPAEAERAVSSIKPTARGTDGVSALRLAAQVPAPRTIVLVSDMARAQFRDIAGAGTGGLAGIEGIAPDLRLVDLSRPGRWNRWIAGAQVRKDAAEVDVRTTPGAPEAILTAGEGDSAARAVVTDRTLSEGPIPLRLPLRPEATILLTSDALPLDDVRYLTRSRRGVRVGFVASARAALYLRAVGASEWKEANATTEGLEAVVLAGESPAEVSASLDPFVRAGGTLLVFGPAAGVPGAAAILPARVRGRLEEEEGLRLAPASRGRGWDPGEAGKIFDGISPGTLRASRIFTRLEIEPTPDAEVIARYEDGTPALLARRHGRGRVILWNASADASWGDLPVRALFPVLLTRLLGEAAANEGLRVGDEITFATTLAEGSRVEARGEEASHMDAAGRDEERPAVHRLTGRVAGGLARFGPAPAPGLYRYENEVVAVNLDPEEGDILPLAPSEILRRLGAGDGRARVEAAGGDIASLLAEGPQDPQGLWRRLVLAALLLAAAEILAGRPKAAA